MKFIEQTVENITSTKYNLEDVYKQIEKVARTCYKSEDTINSNSYEKFVEGLINNKHYSMLEHGIIYLTIPRKEATPYTYTSFRENSYSKFYVDEDDTLYITTNYRVIVEKNLQYYLKYLTVPSEYYHEKAYSFKIITNRAIANEIVRHRVFSFAQESTRWCNYSKDKFNNELTFIKPYEMPDEVVKILNSNTVDEKLLDDTWYIYYNSLWEAERAYLSVLNGKKEQFTSKDIKDSYKGSKLSVQVARGLLPLDLKTELVMTGYEEDWKDFIKKRLVKNAHPQAKEIANMINNYFKFNINKNEN